TIECFDDDHAATAAWARWRFVVGGGRADVIAVGVRGSRRWHIESPSTEFELVGAMAIGEQAVVTDAMEAGWEDVEQETAHELANVETHDLAAMTAVLAIVFPAETDMGRVEIEQTAVGDRDAMRIAREIGQDLLRTGGAFWHRRPIRSCAAARGKLATRWRVLAFWDRRRTASRPRWACLREPSGTGGGKSPEATG